MKRSSENASVPNPGKWIVLLLLVLLPAYLAQLTSHLVYGAPQASRPAPPPRFADETVSWAATWLDCGRYFGSEDLTWDVLQCHVLVAGFLGICGVASLLALIGIVRWRRCTRPLPTATLPDEGILGHVQQAFSSLGLATPEIRILPDLFHLNAHILPGFRRPVLVVTSGLQLAAAKGHRLVDFILTHEAAHVLNRDVIFFYASRFLILGLIVVFILPYALAATWESFAWIRDPSDAAQIASPVAVRWYLNALVRLLFLSAAAGASYLYIASQREVAADHVARRRLGEDSLPSLAQAAGPVRAAVLRASYHPSWRIRASAAKARTQLLIGGFGSLLVGGALIEAALMWGAGLLPAIKVAASLFYTLMASWFYHDRFLDIALGLLAPVTAIFLGLFVGFLAVGLILWSTLCFQAEISTDVEWRQISVVQRCLLNGLIFGFGATASLVILDPEVTSLVAVSFNLQQPAFFISFSAAVAVISFLLNPMAKESRQREVVQWRRYLGTTILAVGVGGLCLQVFSLVEIIGFLVDAFQPDAQAVSDIGSLMTALDAPMAELGSMQSRIMIFAGFCVASVAYVVMVLTGGAILGILGRRSIHQSVPPKIPLRLV